MGATLQQEGSWFEPCGWLRPLSMEFGRTRCASSGNFSISLRVNKPACLAT